MNRLHHWYCNREACKRHVRDERTATRDLTRLATRGVDPLTDVHEVAGGRRDGGLDERRSDLAQATIGPCR